MAANRRISKARGTRRPALQQAPPARLLRAPVDHFGVLLLASPLSSASPRLSVSLSSQIVFERFPGCPSPSASPIPAPAAAMLLSRISSRAAVPASRCGAGAWRSGRRRAQRAASERGRRFRRGAELSPARRAPRASPPACPALPPGPCIGARMRLQLQQGRSGSTGGAGGAAAPHYPRRGCRAPPRPPRPSDRTAARRRPPLPTGI